MDRGGGDRKGSRTSGGCSDARTSLSRGWRVRDKGKPNTAGN